MYPPSALLITALPSLKDILLESEVIHHDITNLHALLHPIIRSVIDINTHDLKVLTLVEYVEKNNINHHQLRRLHPS